MKRILTALALVLPPAVVYGADPDAEARAALALAAAARHRTPVVAVAPAGGPLHSHTCPRCGTTWTHTDDSFGSVAAHTCPACGFGPVWAKSAAGTTYRAPPTTYAPAGTYTLPASSGSSCPSGNCPAPQRRGVFR